MHEAAIILRRELKSYFLSPIAYVFGGLFLGVQLYLSTASSLQNGLGASMQGFFALLPFIFLFFVPALTMRLWAEERKMGTLELLMTFPVTVPQLITGKFLAAVSYLAILLLLTLGYPITLAIYGNVDWGPVLGAYLASMLMASAYLSVGMFFSSMTRDQIVALLLSLVTLGALYMLGWPNFLEALRGILPGWLPVNGILVVLEAVSPFKYFVSIARGVLDTRDFVYYLCFCGFFLHANALVLRARRERG